MSENQNPEIETTDTSDAVEGHGFSSGRIEADEVEGHVMRGKLVADEAEDVEGHGIASNRGISSGRGASVGRFRPDEDEMFGEDVQGHSMRGKLVESESESEDGGGDDVEGHGIGAGRSIGSGRGASSSRLTDPEPQDVQGHAMRGSLVEDEDDAEGHGIQSGR